MRTYFTLVIVALWFSAGCARDDSSPQTSDGRADAKNSRAPETPATESHAGVTQEKRSKAEIDKDNELIDAVDARDIEKCRQLLETGANVSGRYVDYDAFLSAGRTGYTPLMRAAIGGHLDIAKLLLDHQAAVDDDRSGRTAMYFAVVGGHSQIVDLLTAGGASEDPKSIKLSRESIRAACRGFEMGPGEGYPLYPGATRDLEDAAPIAEVLNQGADVNCTDPEGYTPLMYAANLGLLDNVKILLDRGAEATLKNKHGETALSLTARPDSSVNREERQQVVELLQQHLAEKQ
jgi:hypothetical protein